MWWGKYWVFNGLEQRPLIFIGWWEALQENKCTAGNNIIYFLWHCKETCVCLWLYRVLCVSQQRVSSHRWRQECQCSCFSSSVLLWFKLSRGSFGRHGLRKGRLPKVSWHTAVGKQDMSVQLLWCSQYTCNWCECIKISASTPSHPVPLSLSTPHLHLAEAASVINFRVVMVFLEKYV